MSLICEHVQRPRLELWKSRKFCDARSICIYGPSRKGLNRIYTGLAGQESNRIYTALAGQGLNRAGQVLNRIRTGLAGQGLNRTIRAQQDKG